MLEGVRELTLDRKPRCARPYDRCVGSVLLRRLDSTGDHLRGCQWNDVSGRLLTMEFQKGRCGSQHDPAGAGGISGTRPALTNKAGFVTFVVTVGRRSSCRLDIW